MHLLRRLTFGFNANLTFGAVLLVIVVLFAAIGPLLVNKKMAEIGATDPNLAPSAEHILGTDTQGRDVLSELVRATPATLGIGLIAGIIGIALGTVFGILAGYFGGITDSVIRVITDVFITIPSMALLVVIATNVGSMTILLMAFIIASLAWRFPTRTIRSQTLSLRERAYVQVARLNGMGEVEIVFKEVLPNLLPYIAASFVTTVSASILLTVGLEALGLGPQNQLTLGMMIYWSQYYQAILRGFWWWWSPPIVVIVVIFVSLLFISAGVDRFVNTKLKGRR